MDMLKESRLKEWAMDVQEWKESGLTQKQWCEMKGIKLSTFRYRINTLNVRFGKTDTIETCPQIANQQIAIKETTFAKVNLTPGNASLFHSGINIKVGDAQINVSPDANNEHLRLVLEALSYAKRM